LTLCELGNIAYLEEHYGAAIRLYNRATDRAAGALSPIAEGVAACSLGEVYRDLQQFDAAEVHFRQVPSLVREGRDHAELAVVLNAMAHNYRLQGLYAEAHRALRGARGHAFGYQLAQIQMTAGICAVERRRYRRAAEQIEAALRTFRYGGARYAAARCLLHIALIYHHRRVRPQSDGALMECLAILKELGYAQFFMVDGPRCRGFLESAVTRGVGGEFLEGLLARLDRQPIALTSALEGRRQGRRSRFGAVRELVRRPA
jgi:tetratricopeptide (TPR) repeat protein